MLEILDMLIDRTFRTSHTLRAMLVLAGASAGLGSGLTSAHAQSVEPNNHAATTPALQPVEAMVASGRLVEAKAQLERTLRAGGSDADRAAALAMLRSVDAKLRSADPTDVSLQRAEMSLREGDLLGAERWAKTVAGKSATSGPARERADSVLTQVNARRGELRPLVPGMIAQATADFEAGRYGAAKGSILAVLRSGVEIDADTSRTLENQQLRIVELEHERGRNFEVSADAGMGSWPNDQPTDHTAQPGSVRRLPAERPTPAVGQDGGPPFGNEPGAESGGDGGQPASDAPQPAEPLPGEPAASQPAEPVPAAPAATPAPTAPPATSQDDVVRLAMRAEAQRVLTEADQAFDAARYSEAASKYDLVVRNYRTYLDGADVSRAEARLSDSRARLQTNQRGNLAGEVVGINKLRREQAQAEFDNAVAQANTALAAGDPEKANDQQARAGLAIRSARDLFTETEFNEYQTQLDKLKADISAKMSTQIEIQRKSDEDRAIKEAKDREVRQLNERDRKVNESIDRVRALQQERKYDEALAVTEQILFLDPNNPSGLLLKDILRDIILFRAFNQARSDKNYSMAKAQILNEEVLVFPNSFMEFPPDWPAKTFSRGEQSAFNEPRENRAILADLANKKLPADFNENKLEEVLTYVQTLTQAPMDIDWESLESIGVRKDTPISLKLQPLPVQILLDRVLNKAVTDQFNKAGWTVDRGVLVVASQAELNKHTTLVIYNIQDLLFDIPNYTDVPEIDLNSVLQQSQGGGGGQSPFQENRGQDDDRPTRDEKIRRLLDIIQQNVDRDNWADNGGEVGKIQELNGSLIITNTPKNHREIVGLLSKIREIRNMQINVETKFLLVNQGWFEQIGFDLDIVINANNNQVRAARAVDPTIQPGDFFDFSGDGGGSPGLQRQLIGRGTTAGVAPSGQLSTTVIGQGVVNPRGWSPIGAGQNSLGLTNSLAQSSVAEDSLASRVLAASPALGIAGQFLDDVQVDFLIQATQADQRSVQLTAPRLTFTNGQISNIFVVTQQAFVSDLQPIVGDSAVGFDPTVAVASEGVTMLVEGVISADRRYVTMNIDAGVARIDGFGREAVTAVAGGQLVNSADTNSFIQLPTITVTRVRTTATVPDEGTMLLGGQRLVTEVEVETGVPVLSKIPILNRFFTNRVESKEEQTLLILVKPTILIQTEQEERSNPGLLDAVRSGIGGR